MNSLMLSWEYPPRIVGGLARNVYWLSKELSRLGVRVVIITLGFPGLPPYEKEENLEVYRVDAYRLASPSFLDWVYQFNATMIETASKVMKEKFDIIHAHDWLVSPAAISLKHIYRVPLYAHIHSTELGRRGGLLDNFQRHIHELEWLLTYEAWRVAVCSHFMRREILSMFGLPAEKVDVLPNGINPFEWKSTLDAQAVRSRYAAPWEKIVLYVGRMVYEKGVHILLEAAAKLAGRSDVKFIFVGDGPMKPQLVRRAHEIGVGVKAFFTGFIDDQELRALYSLSDVAVFPSLYEPFGIVALEAMAARRPVVASNIGGFSEIIKHGETGILVPPNDPASLASALTQLLEDPNYARWIGENGWRLIGERYRWEEIAKKTLDAYGRVRKEYEAFGWRPRT
ncbi:MAG: glycosyltransferase family 4 protein [Candidatus Bathyarchaeia archaeon]